MEIWPGVLLYLISKYTGLESVAQMEWLSTIIQKKLHDNLSAF